MRPFLPFTLVALLAPAAGAAPAEDGPARAALAAVLGQRLRAQSSEPSSEAITPNGGAASSRAAAGSSPAPDVADAPADVRARAALGAAVTKLARPARAEDADCDCGCREGGVCTCPDCPAGGCLSYAEGRRLALATGKPLAVFVGQPVRAVPGCVVCGARQLPGAAAPCVVLGRRSGQALLRVADLPGEPAREAIQAVLGQLAPTPRVISAAPMVPAMAPLFGPPTFGGMGFGGGWGCAGACPGGG